MGKKADRLAGAMRAALAELDRAPLVPTFTRGLPCPVCREWERETEVHLGVSSRAAGILRRALEEMASDLARAREGRESPLPPSSEGFEDAVQDAVLRGLKMRPAFVTAMQAALGMRLGAR